VVRGRDRGASPSPARLAVAEPGGPRSADASAGAATAPAGTAEPDGGGETVAETRPPIDAGARPALLAEPAARPQRPGPNVRRPADRRPADRPKPPPPPPPAGIGRVTVAADPFAMVRIDGVDMGTTPIFREIAAGPHEVVLIHPDTGAIRLRRVVKVEVGATVEVIAR
jgi:hypothetical protein